MFVWSPTIKAPSLASGLADLAPCCGPFLAESRALASDSSAVVVSTEKERWWNGHQIAYHHVRLWPLLFAIPTAAPQPWSTAMEAADPGRRSIESLCRLER